MKNLHQVLLTNNKGNVYRYVGDITENGEPAHEFLNLSSGGLGVLKTEEVNAHLKLPVNLNLLASNNPSVVKLIEKLKLSIQP